MLLIWEIKEIYVGFLSVVVNSKSLCLAVNWSNWLMRVLSSGLLIPIDVGETILFVCLFIV